MLLKKYKIVRTRIYGNAHPLGGWQSKTDGVVKGFFGFCSKKIFFNAPEGKMLVELNISSMNSMP